MILEAGLPIDGEPLYFLCKYESWCSHVFEKGLAELMTHITGFLCNYSAAYLLLRSEIHLKSMSLETMVHLIASKLSVGQALVSRFDAIRLN